ncbi:MAG: exo-beta-N-acetylmuramidase NamZ family protein, partial [Bacteroidia bacterium]
VSQNPLHVLSEQDVTVGAACFKDYLPKLSRKNVAVVTNNSGLVGKTSIVDTLLHLKVNVKKIFGPEHGFRGTADAGETVKSSVDKKTNLPVISLYGTHKKPTQEDLAGIDVVVYDIQDVGVRFYTFISTLTYVMEACAENGKTLIVLDRPNPNGFYVDGPTMTDRYKGFLGIHNVPLVYGMTTGEYAQMVNGEGWLPKKSKCDLIVVPVKGYDHSSTYDLPVKPSPNLPDLNAVLLYPSLGLFEGTVMSLGRGTDMPFEVIGHPKYSVKAFSFVPKANAVSKDPKYKYEVCYGVDLRKEQQVQDPKKQIQLKWLIMFYKDLKDSTFFDGFFNYHSGNTQLQMDIKQGKSEEAIREDWKDDLNRFKAIRKKYLLYKDFE